MKYENWACMTSEVLMGLPQTFKMENFAENIHDF